MPEEHSTLSIRDHDLLIRLDQKVDGVIESVQRIETNVANRLTTLEKDHVTQKEYNDHEKRLRFVERYVWGAIAIIGLINIVGIGFIIAIFQKTNS